METPIAGSHLAPYISQQLSTSSLAASMIGSTITLNDPATVKAGLYIYPNPVSNQTNVEFTLTEAGQTDIALINTKGQFISKLFTGPTEANVKKSFILNAETLKNGVYIINLISGKNSFTKKIVVVK
ncbi:T9SS type A sorting domain-containing protein [Mucilaginibacter arboris]|uniref:T9SS type A sorting domain-containing protein n=1 Tax=Mucilaginibacter arboris TaxID=2682090 RepID=A0A7K1SVP9_9SPHI|nr:T9SS type A sorting domain-containing protein [Mucilaginibacter arboris]MVN21395.1 T9SS type A sorting domain-containing protein [Mucilaginibacter arboris]